MKSVLIAVGFVIIAHFEVFAQPDFRPGDPPTCNIPFTREFAWLTEEIGRDFTEPGSHLGFLLPDDFIFTWADGEVLDKEQFLRLRANPKLKIKSFKVVEDNKSYRGCLYGSLGMATGIYLLEGRLGDRKLGGWYRYTAIYAKRPGHWQPVAFHSSRLAQVNMTLRLP